MPDALANVREVLTGLDRAVADTVDDAADHAMLADVGAPILVDQVVREVTDAVGDDTAGQHAGAAGADGKSKAADTERAQARGGAAGGGDTHARPDAERRQVAHRLTRVGDVSRHALRDVLLSTEIGADPGRGEIDDGDAGPGPGQVAREAADLADGVADRRDVARAEARRLAEPVPGVLGGGQVGLGRREGTLRVGEVLPVLCRPGPEPAIRLAGVLDRLGLRAGELRLRMPDPQVDIAAVSGLGAEEAGEHVADRGPVALFQAAFVPALAVVLTEDRVADPLQPTRCRGPRVHRVPHAPVPEPLVAGPPALRGRVGQARVGRLPVRPDRHFVRGRFVGRLLQSALDLG